MSDISRFLITTADERTWRFNKPVLFLGEWCRLYERRKKWKELNTEIVPYHWDDREKYYRDYTYLQDIYELILSRAGDALNQFHTTNHSKRYWRILIGPWLYTFVHVLFDRWFMIHQAASNYEIESTIILNQEDDVMIPGNMLEYQQLIWDDQWNHFILGKVIKTLKPFSWSSKELISNKIVHSSSVDYVSFNFKQKIFEYVERGLEFFIRNNDAFIIQSTLPKFHELLLQVSLGQVPILWRSPRMKRVVPDSIRRQSFKLNVEGSDEFVNFVCAMVSKQIPVVYLEAYDELLLLTQKLTWPSKPRVIFTANAYESDEVFKLWAADKIESGSPLVIGQHGGFFGTGKWAAGEDHQVKIANRFLTWGWIDSRETVYPGVALANVGKTSGMWRKDGDLLLVTVPMTRYSWKSSSWPVAAHQSDIFINDQLRFAGLLTSEIREKLVVRLYKWFDDIQKTSYCCRWRETFPNVIIDPSTESIEPLMRDCRLFFSTYNATTFLSSLGRNIPTIMFWNPVYMELRDNALSYFERLKQAGIFHITPESAAAKIVEIWDDVEGWWNQSGVQEARQIFCDHFAYMPRNPIQVLKRALNFK